ncbi:HAD hydrolase-like protein (plasmid) [Nostoc edaphicum CCNP1411]|uniref:HAD hydrolase-like protein n=1 Tax=Nostoc edaphicum CCNP1411 TaxID=1472755 RepID=A0A7D7L857_9NOSO|nr:HAD hydrolase-like protein [Nostoc edaphicum]QMS86256.1 HAD hydrolase-like protein [Nostoc edaphicum CCNP1411]
MLKVAQVDDLLEQVMTSTLVQASKPAPDIVEAAFSKEQLNSEKVVMLRDSHYEIELARKAGVDVIA